MSVVRHEAVFLMLFSAVDLHTDCHAGQIPDWEIQTPQQFLSSPKVLPVRWYRRCSPTLDKPSWWGVWQTFGFSARSTVDLSRSEWPPLRCRLCGPGQDTGWQDCENCFSPRLPPLFFLPTVECGYMCERCSSLDAWNWSVSLWKTKINNVYCCCYY